MIVRKARRAKNKCIPPAVAVATVVFSIFSLSVFYDVRTVESFSTSRPRAFSSRRQDVVVLTNERVENTNMRTIRSVRRTAQISMGATDTIPPANNNNNSSSSSSRRDTQTKRREKTATTNTKKYKDRKEQQQREKERRELKNKLLRARDSILYYGKNAKDKTNTDERPSNKLQTKTIPTIIQSYTSAILQASSSSASSSDLNYILDPWEFRDVFLLESRPVQERILGLLAILMQATTHLAEEYSLFANEKYTKSTLQTITDRIEFLQSRLWKTCRELLIDMVADGPGSGSSSKPHELSPIAVTALATAMRESTVTNSNGWISSPNYDTIDNEKTFHGANNIKELIQLVHDARISNSKASQNTKSEHTTIAADDYLDRALLHAWNCYLSSLCDNALATTNPSDAGLEAATNLLVQTNGSEELVKRDISSYNTVMGIAGRLGNTTLVDTLWQDLTNKRSQDQELSLRPNSRTYNARLVATNDFLERLNILDTEILPEATRLQEETANSSSPMDPDRLVIDGFTLDMVLMPLLQANRKEQLFRLIDDWMLHVKDHQHNEPRNKAIDERQRKINNNKAQRAFQNALSAFFITLVQRNGDVRTAREIWNRYMRMERDSTVNIQINEESSSLNSTNIVIPERRHYNILLDGYARLVDQVRDRQGPYLDISEEPSSVSKAEKKTTRIWNTKSDEEEDTVSTSVFYHEVQEKAIHDGQELFALMMAQQQQNPRNKVGSDMYTKSTMIRLCRSGSEVQNLLHRTSDVTLTNNRSNGQRTWLPRSVVRAAVTTCGRLGDPSMACKIFEEFMFPENDSEKENFFSNYRAFNTLLGALANGAKMDNPKLDVSASKDLEEITSPTFLLSRVHGLTCTEAVIRILNLMTSKNSQTYCVAAAGLQYSPIGERVRYAPTNTKNSTGEVVSTPLALQVFHNATRDGIQADGRLVNAIFRCYGDDIAGALDGWKTDIRRATHKYENRVRQSGSSSSKKKNMLAAYNGLLYVCGRAERPDIAVRIVYAMKNKEGLDPSENPYNNYKSGKTAREALMSKIDTDDAESTSSSQPTRSWQRMRLPKLGMVSQYENILYVECKKYDTRDRRMEKDKRVRIIV